MEDVLTQLSMMSASGAYAARWGTISAAMQEIAALRAKLQAAEATVENQRKELRLLQDATSLNEKYYKYAQQLRVAKESGAYALLIAEHAETRTERDALATANAELTAHCERLRERSQAVIDRWDSPAWKDVPHTAGFINALRSALAASPAQSLVAIERRAAAKALREVSTRFRTPDKIDTTGFWAVMDHMDSEAERLEEEGGNAT